ncbi:aspartate kinase [Salipaludibacillus agaradhaerens]|uniref:aspartate kinase n=1 Tax=Salipaludibacillus agaradhaerens TaxID=76935 RepID=UPI002150C228|nr:aspartate kinase [Salipaludibacillus agaradhaerens]MCR6107521.1 aspartate kinase [Salipaludibacillus agaradhaerens]MCR6119550.1 aspartate kinase [Salipaludibacillus agaradhaerens]UJW58571.1 aspartate kinase [Bacillus sp. A116_S68]
MTTVVQKFGGTSVGDVTKIKRVAKKIKRKMDDGQKVVTVVSAMGKSTDKLVELANDITDSPDPREMDMLLTTGEQVTISLVVMALKELGVDAVSLTGWQAGIETEDVHQDARITDIKTENVQKHLDEGKAVLVAGFQGISASGNITTLGRGGSDTTAVALAAALEAETCSIYTDVTGVFTADPRYVKKARKLDSIAYDEMLELANLGAGVLHPRAVEFAKNYNVSLIVRSSMEDVEGTLVEEEATMEQNLVVRGLAFEENVTKITIERLPNRYDTMSVLFTLLAEKGINVDIIIQQMTADHGLNVSFSIDTANLGKALDIIHDKKAELCYSTVRHESSLAKVSIVGSGMVSNPGVAANMFKVLAEQEVAIKMVSTSEIAVSAVVPEETMVKAVEALHAYFDLDAKEKEKIEAVKG